MVIRRGQRKTVHRILVRAVRQGGRGGGGGERRQRRQRRRRRWQPARVRTGHRHRRLGTGRRHVEVSQVVHVLVVERRRGWRLMVQITDRGVICRRRRWQGVQRRVVLGGAVAPRWRGGLFGGQLPLGRTALQVAGQTQPQRVLHVQSFDPLQVAGHLGHALPETHAVVVHGVLVWVVGEWVQTWNKQSN